MDARQVAGFVDPLRGGACPAPEKASDSDGPPPLADGDSDSTNADSQDDCTSDSSDFTDTDEPDEPPLPQIGVKQGARATTLSCNVTRVTKARS